MLIRRSSPNARFQDDFFEKLAAVLRLRAVQPHDVPAQGAAVAVQDPHPKPIK
jgi:hypothetical protein